MAAAAAAAVAALRRGRAGWGGALGAARALATGPATSSKGAVSDELLAKLKSLSTQSLVDGQWVLGWPGAHISGARGLTDGQKMAGRAVTVRFVPARPDIMADKPPGGESPEYEAFEQCGPNEVIVFSSVGKWESVGGDIKFLRLAQRKVGGLVTDGSVRDTDVLRAYGFPVFSHSTTPRQGPHAMQPWEAQGVVNCGGVTVRPGDAVVGDQDGVVVVPAAIAEEVYEIAHNRELVEEAVKEQLLEEKCPPGKYYPFMSGKIKRESPLGQLLDRKGIKPWGQKWLHSRAGAPGGRRGYASAAAAAGLEHAQSEENFAATKAFFKEHKSTAVLRTNDKEFAPKAMEAAIEGGFKIVEFTLTTPGCLDLVRDFSPQRDILVGCGTVMNEAECQAAMAAGAQFIVSPVLIPEVVEWCVARNIVCVPGCQTPTEMQRAYDMGAAVQKLFPGVAGGANTVKAVSAALPHLTINPTSGVELENCADYVRAGASSLGFVASLFQPGLMGKRDYDGLVDRAKQIVAAVKSA